MEYIKVFIIVQFILLIFQFIKPLNLELYQYYELIFGSFFMIIFFGGFGYLLTLEFLNPESQYINNVWLFATLYAIWYYFTKIFTNLINSDNNNVIYY
jgi:hypothetical protein